MARRIWRGLPRPSLAPYAEPIGGELGWTEFYCRGFGTYYLKRAKNGALHVMTGSRKTPASATVHARISAKVVGLI